MIRRLFLFLLIGLMLGALWSAFQSRRYLAIVTLFFPEVQSQTFANLTQALKAGPDRLAGPVQTAPPSRQVAEIASLIFQSDGARQFVLVRQGSKGVLDLRISSPQDSALRLEVEARDDENARNQLQLCLDYYQGFLKKNSLSRSSAARKECESRLANLVKELRQFEEKLSQSAFVDLRRLGDSAIKANPKVLSQLWIKRIEEDNSSRSLLDLMQRVRGSEKAASEEGAWMAGWGAGLRGGPRPSRVLARPVRRQDLLDRAALEREYYQALLSYRSLVLQRSFLLTCERLESYDYQILDPLHVVTKPRGYREGALKGMLFALLVYLILSSVTAAKPSRSKA